MVYETKGKECFLFFWVFCLCVHVLIYHGILHNFDRPRTRQRDSSACFRKRLVMQMTDMLVLVIIACSALLQLALANAAIDSQDEINGTAKNTGNILFLESPGGELGVLHAVEMAIEDVNNSPDVLPGYTLSLLCNSTEGTV